MRPVAEDDGCRGANSAYVKGVCGAPSWTASNLPISSGAVRDASLLLQQGESPAYVQRQLGHASIQLTVDTYGKWLPMGNTGAVNRLDDESGSKNGDGHPAYRRSARQCW